MKLFKNSGLKKIVRAFFIVPCFSFSVFLFSCGKSSLVHSLNENKLFELGYGNFEDELNLFDLAQNGSVRTYMNMCDGFFYVANGESKKIIELNSYGDLLSIYYNADYVKNFAPSDKKYGKSARKSISYPFNTLGPVSVDSKKCIYVVDTLPYERQEKDSDRRLLLSNVVLRFDGDGHFIDYLGQQGPGGMPFPFIDSIYTTRQNELVVVCKTNDGPEIFWFNTSGYLLYRIPVTNETVPSLKSEDDSTPPSYVSICSVVPDSNDYRLYIKIDYYSASLDPALKVQSGIDYEKTLLYPLDVKTGRYSEPLEIPPYENVVTENLTKESYVMPYDFLGVTDTGWFFFIIPTEDGFLVQMVQPDGQRIVKRSLSVDHSKIFYYTLSLSNKGIISALFVKNEKAEVCWWRTDSLLMSFIDD